MPRPISVSICHTALKHNLQIIRQHLDRVAQVNACPPALIYAVIKANAYGHGIRSALKGFTQAQGLAMLDLDEAVQCRQLGWKQPILMLEGFFELDDLRLFDEYDLSTVIHTSEQLNMLECIKLSRPLDVLIKLNSGMNRLGFSYQAYPNAFKKALQLQAQGILGQVGQMTHFATADGELGVKDQMKIFEQVTSDFTGPTSLCNSAALLRFPELTIGKSLQSFNQSTEGLIQQNLLPVHQAPKRTKPLVVHLVRPGICLYGSSPFTDIDSTTLGLKPAMSLHSAIIAIQHIRPQEIVGYGAMFRTPQHLRIGVVACGYADGYPRQATTGTPIVVAGKRTRVVGQVSMDMLTVDLTEIPEANIGSPVILWGEAGPSVDEVARAGHTLGYELLCALAPRVRVKTSNPPFNSSLHG